MRDIVLALFIFGTIPFILARPYIGLLVWSWLGYMNPHRLCYGFAYSFPWVQLIAIVTLVSLVVSKESKKIPLSTVSVLLFVFLAWTGITTIFAVESASAVDKFEQFAKVLTMVFVTLILVNDRRRMHWLVWMIVVSIGFYGIKGGLFTVLKGGAYHVLGPAKSFIADNNDLAQALCMVIPLIRYLQLQATRKSMRTALGLAMFLTGFAILGTYSRGGLIALAVAGAALFLKSRGRIAVVVAILALGFTAYHFMPEQWTQRMDTLHHAEEVKTAQTRIQSWEFATNVALHKPLLGGGFEVYKNESMWEQYGPEDAKQRAIHSIYFRVLAEQGFPGLVLFIALLAASWRNCSQTRKLSRDSPDDKWAFDLASMLQVSLLAFMTAGLATTSSYFDLSFQLMAMCALLKATVTSRHAQLAAVGATASAKVLKMGVGAVIGRPRDAGG